MDRDNLAGEISFTMRKLHVVHKFTDPVAVDIEVAKGGEARLMFQGLERATTTHMPNHMWLASPLAPHTHLVPHFLALRHP